MKKLGPLAYNKLDGKSPTVVFLSGFKSDMEGAKALYVESLCRETGNAFIRFDYSGTGQSAGNFEDGTIGKWKDDALKIIDEVTSGELILIGSSMGGWIMLLAALARPDRIKALIGIAAAPDFTEELIWNLGSEKDRHTLMTEGKVIVGNCEDGKEPYPITRDLIEDGRRHLLLQNPINLNVPIRLIHGKKDQDVSYQTSNRIAARLTGKDVIVDLVENGDHRMSAPENLELLRTHLLAIMKII